jgi:hypothetical protein
MILFRAIESRLRNVKSIRVSETEDPATSRNAHYDPGSIRRPDRGLEIPTTRGLYLQTTLSGTDAVWAG